MMSLDELTHTRTVYNLLDYLGDIGGCLDALKYIGAFLVWILSGDSLGEYLATEMFKVDDYREPNAEDDQDYAQQTFRRIKSRKRFDKSCCLSPLNCFLANKHQKL